MYLSQITKSVYYSISKIEKDNIKYSKLFRNVIESFFDNLRNMGTEKMGQNHKIFDWKFSLSDFYEVPS